MSIVRINEGEGNGVWDPNGFPLWDDPFVDFAIPQSISNLFPGFGFELGSSMNARVDLRETPIAHVWKVVLPGFRNEDVLIELQDERVLQVSVESGNFLTKFKIPDNGNLQQLKANMHHGTLVVTVPKFHQPPPNHSNVRVVEIDATD